MEVDRAETSSAAGVCLPLGSPTFIDIGNGRLRCKETGHEFPAKDMDSYAQTKSCRLALIDVALSRKQPPLHTFLPHSLSKSKLLCSLTGDTINKSEEHIWKHINGKRFLKKLDEVKMRQSPEKVEKDVKKSRKLSNLNSYPLYCRRAKAFMPTEPAAERRSSDSEEPNFWIPTVRGHWDSDDEKVSWESRITSFQETEANQGSGLADEGRERESLELSIRIKRMAIAVGPSSFASRKKKNKKGSSSTVPNMHGDV
ncbi:uncharacterized protein LOC110114762 isoform X2 [Dendrobium catenatum]|uniref:Surfeit locus protein 2 n=1 Tax=Dendrobium catenatum TaxID=906689 RepID=A0A2I0X138_9ASPA|nr:uncharacterized protein LOC110114762 isoform X2 [Dendrobium catenatum]PKU81638.1 hypothetical protein MA16_Dca013069 [Dendrobium catenatum]